MANWLRKWNVTSHTNKSKTYVVSEGTATVLGKQKTVRGCSCASWRFKKVDPLTGLRPDCKHITATFGTIRLEKQLAIEEETRLLLDEWAVVEVTRMPQLNLLASMDDRSI